MGLQNNFEFHILNLCLILGFVSFCPVCYAIQTTEGPFLCGAIAKAQTDNTIEKARYIHTVTYRGNSSISEGRLAELSEIRRGQKFDPKLIDDALSRILDEYKRLGYFFARAGWEHQDLEKDRVSVQININEGEVLRFGNLELSGNFLFSADRLLRVFDLGRGEVFNESDFQKGLERLLELYNDSGHPLAKLSPSDFFVENGTLGLKINIDEGPLVRINEIRINGLKKTKERTVLRELAVNAGDEFDQRKIDESQRKLNNLGYFQDARESFTQSENDVILEFLVTEGKTGQFSGVMGYNPSEFEGEKFTGMLEAVETNLLGTGRKLAARARLGLIDSYEFSYLEPWLLGKPFDIGIRLWRSRHETQDLTSDIQEAVLEVQDQKYKPSEELAASLSWTARINRLTEGSLTVTYKRIKSPVSTSDGIGLYRLDSMISGENYGLALSAQRDSRDYFINPSTGSLLHSAVELSRGDFKIIKLWIDLSRYVKTWHRQILAIGLHGARVWGEAIPITEMMYLGGANTLRGYAEDFFRGEGRFFANWEYRFLVSRDSQFFLFLDMGTVYGQNEGMEKLRQGYGLGMRLRSQTGLISLDYGLARGDSILDGKIHVSLGTKY